MLGTEIMNYKFVGFYSLVLNKEARLQCALITGISVKGSVSIVLLVGSVHKILIKFLDHNLGLHIFTRKAQLMQRGTRDSGACLKAHCEQI